ncbi:hypothetical protein K250101E9_35810 [Enterocloster aldenensis]
MTRRSFNIQYVWFFKSLLAVLGMAKSPCSIQLIIIIGYPDEKINKQVEKNTIKSMLL